MNRANQTPPQSDRAKATRWAGGILMIGAVLFGGGCSSDSQPAVLSPGAPLTVDTTFRDCATCPPMRVLAPGTFEQGTPTGSADALPYEQPAHAVTIEYSFAAGINEVTVGQFAEFATEYPRDRKGCDTYDGEWRAQNTLSWRDATRQQDDSYPVTCVSWQDASDYAAWLSLRTGETYRLPSASEWEYLARAGLAAVPWTQREDACAHANAADTTAVARFPGWAAFECRDQYVESAPVGTFASNAFGLTDTLGNAFEWVQDCWRDDYTNAPADGAAVLEGDCGQREARGGSWFTTPAFVRAAYRNRYAAAYRSNSLGFRLVREIKKQ
jgi:formylglycine-generating enzyme required for sulfatase activity